MKLDNETLKVLVNGLENRIESIYFDLRMGHIYRVEDGIKKRYADENQAMIVVDHLMRIRIYQDIITELKHLQEETN